MVKKGKKKKLSSEKEESTSVVSTSTATASTSKATSSKQSQKEEASQHKKVAQSISQKQGLPPQQSQTEPQQSQTEPQHYTQLYPQLQPQSESQPQLQGVWGKKLQQQQQIASSSQEHLQSQPQTKQQKLIESIEKVPQPKQPGPSQPGPSQQRAWGQSQQGEWNQSQQGAWGQSQQGAWGQSQQGPWGKPQQGAWGKPQQGAWSQSQQSQAPQQQSPYQQIPQRGWGQSQQQILQVPTVDIGGAGDSKLETKTKSVIHSDIQMQPSTSAQSEFSHLSLKDTLRSTKTSQKGKMTSSTMKQYQLSIPQRKDPMKAGTKGIPIRVYTNMFEIIFNSNFITNAVHYDVTITPIASKTLYKKIFEQCRVDHFKNRYPAYDGKKNAYSANDLPFIDFMESNVELYDSEREKQRTFKITLKKVANIDLSWIKKLRPGLDEANRDQTGIQVLDIIMRHAPESRFLTVGKSLFWEINDSKPLGGGLSLSRGGFSSAILGWKPYINIDVSHKGFVTSQNVVNLMAEMTRARGDPNPMEINKRYNWEKIEKFLKGLKVIYQIPNQSRTKRTYRLNGLGPSAIKHQFDCNGSMMTIKEYFARMKSYNLRYPDLPCLWAGATNRTEKIYLPAELCTIMAGQITNKKFDEEQTSSMIRYAATSAPERKKRIEEAFARIDINNSFTMKHEFHLNVHPEMKQVAARILPAPILQYNETTAKVNKGIWQMQTFQKASNLEKNSWTILNLSEAILGTLLQDFVSLLRQCAREVGMYIDEPQASFKSFKPYNTAEITEYFKSNRGLKLIIVIIPDRTDTTYGKVKQITELSVGVLTQCIKFRTLRKNSYSAVKNILLKINSKLNGVNHTLTSNSVPQCLKNNDCMLVGADVTHPSPDAVNIPSIAAVAASSNTSAFQYNIALRLQQPKEEMILDLEDIIISQLLIYRNTTSRLPKKIIYYRDGVSEGQLAQVMYFEINAIKRACKKCKAEDIQITCLVVQKRHHVRLFPMSDRESDDKNKNVKAGTIVDTEITHPNHIDFYLVSHASIQGTARPTKYRCICNESNYTEDNIEELTYYLCHMYARCTRAVSYPAPTYYAHLAAYRGRALIQGINIKLDNLDAEQNKLCMKMSRSPMCFV